MKKIITTLVLMLSFSFAQDALYHMQSLIGPKDGVSVKQFEIALKKHNKVHTSDLNALNTWQIVAGPSSGDFYRVPANWPVPHSKVEDVLDALNNHATLPGDKLNDLTNLYGGMEFWILDEDLSVNLDKLNPEEPFDFVSVFYYGMPTGDRSKALEIFKDFKDASEQTEYDRVWWVMTKASGGNMNVVMYATPHKTRSEMLAPDFALRAKVLNKMAENNPEMSLSGAWTWTQNQVLKLRRDLSTSSN